ncbi:MAG: M81 family metallopeptidase [Spirochaetes bacterium]|nr:M81 family metallopeptidase [Spirochaetota bacterium]MBU1079857.1 M81 family metallopeptidase [Spirochaetota bacterium]
MRIITGGMNHESNTLNPIITGEDDFVIFRGERMLSEGMLPYYSSTGVIRTLRETGCEVVPTVLARAVPNGVVSARLYAALKAELLERVEAALAAGPVDGACFGLHGSMKVEGLGCAEGDLLAAVRKLLPGVPVTVALDMHATVTDELLAHADGLVGYKTAPHVDCAETGAHAARMLLTALRTGKRLVTARRSIPMLVAGEKSESAAEPMRSLLERCREAEKAPGVMAASLLLGFPWADDEHGAVTALVTTLGDGKAAKEAAQDIADGLAEAFWARRRDFVFRSEYYDSAEAMRVAYKAVLEEGQAPVFVSDSGDNPTAGSTGDSTDVLERVLETMGTVDSLPTPLLYSGFYDAAATAACLAAGAGASIDVTVGGTWDRVNGKRITLGVEILRTIRGYGPYASDVALVRHRNVALVLTSKHIGFGDEELLPALGVRAEDHCLVVVKLGYLEACFRDVAARAIMATSKGCSNEVLESIPYRKIRRPIYPLDPSMSFMGA